MRRWEGVCYDGPKEGEHIAMDRPWFRVALMPPLSSFIPGPTETIPFGFNEATYVWSRALRKWVFDPRR